MNLPWAPKYSEEDVKNLIYKHLADHGYERLTGLLIDSEKIEEYPYQMIFFKVRVRNSSGESRNARYSIRKVKSIIRSDVKEKGYKYAIIPSFKDESFILLEV